MRITIEAIAADKKSFKERVAIIKERADRQGAVFSKRIDVLKAKMERAEKSMKKMAKDLKILEAKKQNVARSAKVRIDAINLKSK